MVHEAQDRPALTDLEITPAMIAAGAEILLDYDPESESVSDVAARVFEAMLSAAR